MRPDAKEERAFIYIVGISAGVSKVTRQYSLPCTTTKGYCPCLHLGRSPPCVAQALANWYPPNASSVKSSQHGGYQVGSSCCSQWKQCSIYILVVGQKFCIHFSELIDSPDASSMFANTYSWLLCNKCMWESNM